MTSSLQKAISAHQSGNFAEAERFYREVLAAEPHQADALALLGVALDAKGDHAQAIEYIEKAIRLDPNAALFKLHLGNALMSAERFAEAAIAFGQAILLQPDMPQAHFNFGNALRKTGDWPGAIAAYREAVQHNRNYAEAYNNLALSLIHEKQYDEALVTARQSIAAAPNFGDAWLTLCNVAEQVKKFDVALEAGERVVELMSDNHKAWFGYGVALNRTGRHEEAIGIYRRALALKPERADIWDNLGQTYQSLNRLEEAEAAFRKTIEVAGQIIANEDTREVAEEEYGNRHWHLALIELLRGEYKQGFARYRARFEDIGDLKRAAFPQPLWRGENLDGKTILICDEQGFGDTLMFCRYLPLLKTQGARVIFSVHPALEPLFRNWSGADEIIVHGQKPPAFDFHATTFDLPHRFGTTLETVPGNVPYLPLMKADEHTRLEQFNPAETGGVPLPSREGLGEGARGKDDSQFLSARPRGTPPHLTSPSRGEEHHRPLGNNNSPIHRLKCLHKIAVVWGGSPLHKNDENRSIPLKIFADLFNETGAQFYSLNRDLKPGDAELLPSLPVVDLAPRIRNFADAASFMQQCDLVITVDTATAHLAGGLGRPVWVLLPFAPDWRWMIGRDDSPWHPTMRLFRQTQARKWGDVVAQTRKSLRELIG